MLKQKQTIVLNDLGQGNRNNIRKTTTVNRLLNRVQSSSQKAQLLFRIANHYQCFKILEIGTSLGLTTAYLANSNKKAKVVTIEGRDGTQKMLKRCKSKKFRNKGVLVKFPKKKQDLRIDLPAIGLKTLTQCKSAGLKGIVLKSKLNVFLEQKKSISFANKNKMFILVK